MANELIVNVTPYETRVALLEDRVLAELYIERTKDRGIMGNIYKGKVVKVLPGMQAAFVDIGLEKAAFLYGEAMRWPGGTRFCSSTTRSVWPARPATRR